MNRKYWLMITNLENWEIVKGHSVYGFRKKDEKYLSFINIGDYVLMYVIPKKIGGIFKIYKTSKKATKNLNVDFKGGPYPIKIKLEKVFVPKDFLEMNENIIKHISIFKNVKRWGTILMGRSLKEITKEDFIYIKSMME